MKTRFKLGLFFILAIYSLLYIATTKPYREQCDELCQKFDEVYKSLLRDRPYIFSAGMGRDSMFLVFVKDSTQHNWDGLADTTCLYLKFQSLSGYTSVIINQNQDTLAKKKCP